ncbi:MAG: hypothetical protein LBG91_03135, partial [Treponema sp.]|nr:hypothetical protein [Treponema sp.]
MLRKAWLFFTAALVTVCASSGSNETRPLEAQSEVPSVKVQPAEVPMLEQYEAGHWFSGPYDDSLIIIGVSGRLTKPEDEIETARQDAARKASMYQGINGSFEVMNRTGNRFFFDYAANSSLDLQDDTNYEQYLDLLSFNPNSDVIRVPGAVFVRLKYNAPDIANIEYSPQINSGRPAWVNNRDMPVFPDYTTVVGFAGKRSRLKDTVNASCDSAVAALIESASSRIT